MLLLLLLITPLVWLLLLLLNYANDFIACLSFSFFLLRFFGASLPLGFQFYSSRDLQTSSRQKGGNNNNSFHNRYNYSWKKNEYKWYNVFIIKIFGLIFQILIEKSRNKQQIIQIIWKLVSIESDFFSVHRKYGP